MRRQLPRHVPGPVLALLVTEASPDASVVVDRGAKPGPYLAGTGAGGQMTGSANQISTDFSERHGRWRRRCVFGAILFGVVAVTSADQPGRGRTAGFEVNYLRFVIDHHASALRMTELAAGTDPTRDPSLPPEEGVAPTPTFPTTPAKASSPEIRSLARRENRAQREDIQEALMMLRDWYGVTHTPGLTPQGQRGIQILESTPLGSEFDRAFLQVFSAHHYGIAKASLDCQFNRELTHVKLEHMCENIVRTQVNQAIDMREMLCRRFGICDFQPTEAQ